MVALLPTSHSHPSPTCVVALLPLKSATSYVMAYGALGGVGALVSTSSAYRTCAVQVPYASHTGPGQIGLCEDWGNRAMAPVGGLARGMSTHTARNPGPDANPQGA